MLFYKYAGAADGSRNWSIQAKKIGNGWNFSRCLLVVVAELGRYALQLN
jgi:hypothetical protein